MQPNPVCFWELASHDAKKSVKFFEKVFDWKFHYDENTTIYELPAEENAAEFYCQSAPEHADPAIATCADRGALQIHPGRAPGHP